MRVEHPIELDSTRPSPKAGMERPAPSSLHDLPTHTTGSFIRAGAATHRSASSRSLPRAAAHGPRSNRPLPRAIAPGSKSNRTLPRAAAHGPRSNRHLSRAVAPGLRSNRPLSQPEMPVFPPKSAFCGKMHGFPGLTGRLTKTAQKAAVAENSPAIHRWDSRPVEAKVPQGTKEPSCRPWRDFCLPDAPFPSDESLGYFRKAQAPIHRQISA